MKLGNRLGAVSKFGYCALIGRTNAGKSTLLNRLLGEEIALVSSNPQTTRHRILGVLTADRGQVVFVDTPGLHRPLHRLNRLMMNEARSAWEGADLICAIRDASTPFGKGEEYLIETLVKIDAAKIIVLNKVDLVQPKTRLLREIDRYARRLESIAIVPISARTGEGCDRLLEMIWSAMPEGVPRYDPELLTLNSERFHAAEEIRGKILDHTHAELPFVTAVRIERWQETADWLHLDAEILVEKPSQRAILLGREGRTIGKIGRQAREALERTLGRRVVLRLHVRVENHWRERDDLLREFEGESLSVDVERTADDSA